MLHLRAVLLALRTAALAGLDAGAELRAGELEIGPGEARDDPRGHEADVGAIGAIANAWHHLADIFLAKAGIGAGVTSLRAGIAGGDALDVCGVVR